MDFVIDGDANGEANSADVECGECDENGFRGCSVDATFQLCQNNTKTEFCLNEISSLDETISVEDPYIGQEFESEAAAHAFYNAYATKVGFVIRVSKLSRSRRDGCAIGRALVCNKEGFRMPDKREKIVRQRAETRVGCRAMVLVRKVYPEKWVVTKFVKEHTHALSPGKVQKDLIYDQFPNEHDKVRELSQQLAVEKKRAASYKRHLETMFQYIEEHDANLSTKIQHVVGSVREMESSSTATT